MFMALGLLKNRIKCFVGIGVLYFAKNIDIFIPHLDIRLYIVDILEPGFLKRMCRHIVLWKFKIWKISWR